MNLEKGALEPKEPSGLIKMPAFEAYVSPRDVEDLVRFIKASAVLFNPEGNEELRGRDLVLDNACFSCPGPLGGGGIKNPGSFKGYIPSLIGDDFGELVRDDGELREWIREGIAARFRKFPASFFTQRQAVKMPEYKNVFAEQELEAVIAYLKWLRQTAKAEGLR